MYNGRRPRRRSGFFDEVDCGLRWDHVECLLLLGVRQSGDIFKVGRRSLRQRYP